MHNVRMVDVGQKKALPHTGLDFSEVVFLIFVLVWSAAHTSQKSAALTRINTKGKKTSVSIVRLQLQPKKRRLHWSRKMLEHFKVRRGKLKKGICPVPLFFCIAWLQFCQAARPSGQPAALGWVLWPPSILHKLWWCATEKEMWSNLTCGVHCHRVWYARTGLLPLSSRWA